MSTLKETLDQRRIGETEAGHVCHSTNAAVSTLLLEASNGESWLLPWQHFLDGRHQTMEKIERLVLTFATQEILIEGRNLETLADEIAHLRLKRLRPAPAKYQKSSGADAFVTKIEVRSRAKPDADIGPGN
ncbi:MAG: hypothetical protein PHQ04_04395 [Opitutaceae bacterium]|nr:hypothetical protein [Opitutaceae bacterium]